MISQLSQLLTCRFYYTLGKGLTFLIFLFIVIGCLPPIRNFSGLEPVSPPLSIAPNSSFMTTVDSLQPEFKWQAAQGKDNTYDFAIWEQEKRDSTDAYNTQRTWGTLYYYVENLKENYHKIKNPLKPNEKYFWSVRVRRGDSVGNWSTQSGLIIHMGGQRSWSNYPYDFKTPSK